MFLFLWKAICTQQTDSNSSQRLWKIPPSLETPVSRSLLHRNHQNFFLIAWFCTNLLVLRGIDYQCLFKLSPTAEEPGWWIIRLHLAEVVVGSTSTASLKFKQRLNLFFSCLDLFDSCDVGRGELLASVKFGPSFEDTGKGVTRLGSSELICFSQS